MERWVVRRAPLVPIGSLMTCTSTSWPSWTRLLMLSCGRGAGAGAGTGASSTSPASAGTGSRAGSTGPSLRAQAMSLACRKAARSRPMSTNAACMPGSTRRTRPR